MFSKRDGWQVSTKIDRGGRDGMPSIISGDLHVAGNLSADGEIQIDGIVEGDVSSHSLTVGDGAKVIGEIVAEDIVIRGMVLGSIRAGRIEIAGTAKVVGDIWHDKLIVASGAQLDCQIRRGKGRSADRAGKDRQPKPPTAAGDEGDKGDKDVPVMRWNRGGSTTGRAP